MPSNDWTVGALYIPGGPGGFWTQPDGIGGLVYPQQVTGNSDQLSIKPYNELTGTYVFGCGHSVNQAQVYTDWDYETGMTVALVCCPMCSFCQRFISPASDAIGPSNAASLLNSIIFP